jgi:hypothetical protein
MGLSFQIFTVVTIVGAAAIILALVLGWFTDFDETVGTGTVVFGAILLIVAAFFWIVAWLYVPAASYSENKCGAYGEQTERETRFARYTHWSWDCLVNTDEGWIPKDQLYVDEGVGGGRP